MGACHRSSAAPAARYQLVRSAKIEQTSPVFARSELLQALNTISGHQQALRTLRDKMSELICGGLNLLRKPESTDLSRTPDRTLCWLTIKSRSELTRIRPLLIGCLPFTSVFLVAFPVASCSIGATQSFRAKPCAHDQTAFSRINDLNSRLALKILLHR